MDDGILERFERQVDALIQRLARLKKENASLREQQDILLTERNELHTKQEKTVLCIESMIDRLKQVDQ